MKLYPNPISDLVNVQLTMDNEQLNEIDIQLFDVYGRLLNVVESHGRAALQKNKNSFIYIVRYSEKFSIFASY